MRNTYKIEHVLPPSNLQTIEDFLISVDNTLIPSLSSRVDISQYSKKLAESADIFNILSDNKVIGSVAIYMNQETMGYISSYVILPQYHRIGLGSKLWEEIKKTAKERGIKEIYLQVSEVNRSAISFYHEIGFEVIEKTGSWISMKYQNMLS